MPLRDLACAALGWTIAGLVWAAAGGLPRSLLSDPFGAEGMPRGLALVLAIVSTLIGWRAVVAWRVRRAAEPEPVDWAAATRAHAKALGTAALGVGYVILLPWLGYVATATLLILAVALYYGARPTAALAAISLGGAAFLWALFAKALSVPMPAGFWPRLLG